MYTAQRTHLRPKLTVILIVIYIFSLSACQQAVSNPLPTPSSTILLHRELPDFLLDVYPDDYVLQDEIATMNYGLAILLIDKIASPDDVTDWENCVNFLIDGTKVSVDIEVDSYETESSKRVYVSGKLQLEPGRHVATIQVMQSSPLPSLEYTWEFDVLAEEPTLPGLPVGFQFVRPLPDSVISQQAYREETLVPPRYVPGFADVRNGVCVGVMTDKIVEPGEFLEDDVFSKYHIVSLDGKPPVSGDTIIGGSEPYEVNKYDENGQIIASYVGPHSYQCWHIDLASGKHEAGVVIKKASGETIEYTWQFTITQD